MLRSTVSIDDTTYLTRGAVCATDGALVVRSSAQAIVGRDGATATAAAGIERIDATDGRVGKLSGIAIDDEARITDFYARPDRHGSPELLLPTSAVSFVDCTTVYLQLSKSQLQSSAD